METAAKSSIYWVERISVDLVNHMRAGRVTMGEDFVFESRQADAIRMSWHYHSPFSSANEMNRCQLHDYRDVQHGLSS